MEISCEHDHWQIIGPGGGGAQFLQSISPHDPEFMVVACDMNGGYVSHNGGEHWSEFNLQSRVDAFAFDPHDPDVIYAGTSSTGLFRSCDRGGNWSLLYPHPSHVRDIRGHGDHADNSYLLSGGNWPGGDIVSIRVDPRDADRLYMAIVRMEGQSMILLMSSENGGMDWTRGCSIAGQSVFNLFVDCAEEADDGQIYIFSDTGVYVWKRSSTRARLVSKSLVDQGLLHDASWGLDSRTQSPIFYVLSSSRWSDDGLCSGIWRSFDKGEHWTELDPPVDSRLDASFAEKPPYFSHVRASEFDARWVYVSADFSPQLENGFPADCFHGRYGIIRSTEAGETWEWVLKGIEYTIPENYKVGWVERDYLFGPDGTVTTGLGVCPTNPEICLFGDYMETAKTLDGGQTWTQVYSKDAPGGAVGTNGMDVTTSYGVHVDPFNPNHVVISYTDIGMFHSYDDGETWFHAIAGVPHMWQNTGYWMVFDPDVPDRAWAAWGRTHDLPRPKMLVPQFRQAQGGVTRTDDGLKTWKVSNQGMPENCVTTHLLLDPESPVGQRTLFATGFGRGVFKSTDDGVTWVASSQGIEGNLNVWRILYAPDRSLVVVVARGLEGGETVDGALYRSTDGGGSWRAMPLPNGVNAPNDIVCDPSDPQRMYVACWPSTIDGEERFGGVWATQDRGENWACLFDDSSHVFGLAIDPARPATMYINTFNGGAFQSRDNGITWRKLKGYDFKWGQAPFIDPNHHDRLYLTTFGSSVWRTTITDPITDSLS